jgi:phosphatidylglycerol lysyltransferase
VELEQVESVGDGPVVKASGPGALLVRRVAAPLLSIAMLCLALWALHLFTRDVNYHQIREYVQGLPRGRFVLAALLTALGYAVMTLYDHYALISIGRRLPWRRVGMISFISYAFSNAVGMALLVSGSIRYRF